MKIERFQDYSNTRGVNVTKTSPPRGGCWAGIAIGPDSYEGQIIVEAGGETALLQAGRPLALAAQAYTLRRANGGQGTHPSISRLSVALLESPAELAMSFVRPNHKFFSGAYNHAGGEQIIPFFNYGYPAGGAGATTVPFTSRRKVLFTGSHADSFRVFGIMPREVPGEGQVIAQLEYVLADEVNPNAPGQFAFYVGGTNEAECWNEVQLRVTVGGGGINPSYYTAETIGEIGL